MSNTLLLLSALSVLGAVQAADIFYDVSVSFTGLEDLGDNFRYEGWLVNANGVVTTGVFQAEADGSFDGTFKGINSKINGTAATDFVLTLEPYPDPDPAPASTHIYGGPLAAMGTAGPITINHPDTFDSDFTDAVGNYILAAPSGPADFSLGIWWLGANQAPGLTLPTLPAGWAYEGWVVGDDGPVSTGRFTDPSGPDSDGAGPFAGTQPTPGVPGQDFITPPTDLTQGYTAVISVEPEPDNSAAPFAFKPLVHPIVATEGGVLQVMDQNLGSFGSGEVTLTASMGDDSSSAGIATVFAAAVLTVGAMFA